LSLPAARIKQLVNAHIAPEELLAYAEALWEAVSFTVSAFKAVVPISTIKLLMGKVSPEELRQLSLAATIPPYMSIKDLIKSI